MFVDIDKNSKDEENPGGVGTINAAPYSSSSSSVCKNWQKSPGTMISMRQLRRTSSLPLGVLLGPFRQCWRRASTIYACACARNFLTQRRTQTTTMPLEETMTSRSRQRQRLCRICSDAQEETICNILDYLCWSRFQRWRGGEGNRSKLSATRLSYRLVSPYPSLSYS